MSEISSPASYMVESEFFSFFCPNCEESRVHVYFIVFTGEMSLFCLASYDLIDSANLIDRSRRGQKK